MQSFRSAPTNFDLPQVILSPARDLARAPRAARHTVTASLSLPPIPPVALFTGPAPMALPRHSLRGFLTLAKGALRAALDSNQKVTLVIGNESAGQHLQCTNESI